MRIRLMRVISLERNIIFYEPLLRQGLQDYGGLDVQYLIRKGKRMGNH